MPNRDGTQTRVALRPADTKLQALFAKSVVVILAAYRCWVVAAASRNAKDGLGKAALDYSIGVASVQRPPINVRTAIQAWSYG